MPKQSPSRIPFKMHPRVFAALGADLVTSDVVAVIELVKNSYDALATKVWIRFFTESANGGSVLEIRDNGHGMKRDVIENVWCTVATPFRKTRSTVKAGKIERRVSGEKGLGRLSVGRLGGHLEMLTKAERAPCWIVTVDWAAVSGTDNLDSCEVLCERADADDAKDVGSSGTILRIRGLREDWDEEMIAELEDNLSRLLTPFKTTEDFQIFLTTPFNQIGEEPTAVRPEKFLSKPKYLIKGKVDRNGKISYRYVFKPIDDREPRRTSGDLSWKQVVSDAGSTTKESVRKAQVPLCGAFDFEIRAWDLRAEDTAEVADAHGLKRAQVRKAISAHKGISVYRDGILVLPKSDASRDWLGLDLKRVSRVGDRISTSQIVGYVGISADENPEISDTSDRERFVQTTAYNHFELLLNTVVRILEKQRQVDQVKDGSEQRMESLFTDLIPDDDFLDSVSDAAAAGDAKRVVALLDAHRKGTEKVVKKIERRFAYYSHLATVGAISETIIHEIRGRTALISYFIRNVPDECVQGAGEDLAEAKQNALDASLALESLADRFSPLANRRFRRGKRVSVAEDRIEQCVDYSRDQIQALGVDVHLPRNRQTKVAIDPAEFEAILLNLFSNAMFWIQQSTDRVIEITLRVNKKKRVATIAIHDSGSGVAKEDESKIFLPGVTRKPNGIGMGLTVAGELVAAHGSKLRLEPKGKHGGASFSFDVPLAR